ncbi:MAG: hypothetical protein RG741_01695 [Bacteroidales bacterium]|nr:hypothetical protein [Bacteroidales bacterium]
MLNQQNVARAFSTLFHPILIPTLGLFILFQLDTFLTFAISAGARRFLLLIVFINTAVAPMLSVLLMKHTGYVKDIRLYDRNERILPLMVTIALFFITYYLLRQLALPSLIYFFIISATLLVILTLMVSFFWKISIHMVSLGGLTGFLIITSLLLQTDISWLIVTAILVSGITASSRLILRAHNPAQVYAGYLLGLLAMLLLFYYFRT